MMKYMAKYFHLYYDNKPKYHHMSENILPCISSCTMFIFIFAMLRV